MLTLVGCLFFLDVSLFGEIDELALKVLYGVLPGTQPTENSALCHLISVFVPYQQIQCCSTGPDLQS